MSPHLDRQFLIVLLCDSKQNPSLYFVESQPARPALDFACDWLAKLLAAAGGDAARFEEIANARFSSAGLGEHALRRSLTFECHRRRLASLAATQFSCGERAAAEVYTALRDESFCDYGSDPMMSWCLARCLERNRSIQQYSLPVRMKRFASLQARVRQLLDAHTDPTADALRNAFARRCGLGGVDATGWLPGEWCEPHNRCYEA